MLKEKFKQYGRGEKVEERLETTICNICDWIDSQLDCMSCMDESNVLPVTISALAELVQARANMEYER